MESVHQPIHFSDSLLQMTLAPLIFDVFGESGLKDSKIFYSVTEKSLQTASVFVGCFQTLDVLRIASCS
jgi:hypothetical protein